MHSVALYFNIICKIVVSKISCCANNMHLNLPVLLCILSDKNAFGGYFNFQRELYHAIKSNEGYSLCTLYYENLKKVYIHSA